MKRVSIIAVALLLSVVFASTAFAAQPRVYVSNFDNVKAVSVSFGDHGYYRSGDFDSRVRVPKFTDRKWAKLGDRYVYYDSKGDRYTRYADYDRDGNWYYYIDDHGNRQYVYLNDNYEYDWHRYTDRDGTTQYYVVYR